MGSGALSPARVQVHARQRRAWAQEDKEPEIFRAVRFGTVLENVQLDRQTRVVDFDSSALTENTRACYPIDFIDHARIPCNGPHPK